jgi:hypothetical protein
MELDLLVDEWVDDVAAESGAVDAWVTELPEMFELLNRRGVALGDATRAFVSTWSAMVAANPSKAISDSRSAALIRNREEALKAPHHRLGNPSALRGWDGSLFGSRPLDYRWGISRQLVRDCRLGIEESDAGA